MFCSILCLLLKDSCVLRRVPDTLQPGGGMPGSIPHSGAPRFGLLSLAPPPRQVASSLPGLFFSVILTTHMLFFR